MTKYLYTTLHHSIYARTTLHWQWNLRLNVSKTTVKFNDEWDFCLKRSNSFHERENQCWIPSTALLPKFFLPTLSLWYHRDLDLIKYPKCFLFKTEIKMKPKANLSVRFTQTTTALISLVKTCGFLFPVWKTIKTWSDFVQLIIVLHCLLFFHFMYGIQPALSCSLRLLQHQPSFNFHYVRFMLAELFFIVLGAEQDEEGRRKRGKILFYVFCGQNESERLWCNFMCGEECE